MKQLTLGPAPAFAATLVATVSRAGVDVFATCRETFAEKGRLAATNVKVTIAGEAEHFALTERLWHVQRDDGHLDLSLVDGDCALSGVFRVVEHGYTGERAKFEAVLTGEPGSLMLFTRREQPAAAGTRYELKGGKVAPVAVITGEAGPEAAVVGAAVQVAPVVDTPTPPKRGRKS